jgi:hypothetical protein
MAHFVRSFDCKNEEHVMWLKKLGDEMTMSIGGDRVNLSKTINENPLPGKPSMDNVMDFAYIHFQLCMKYTTAVLNGHAFIPTVFA